MDVRLLLRVAAITVLVLAAALGLRASHRWPARRASGVVAGALAVLAVAGFVLSVLDLLAPHAPVPDVLSIYYAQGDTLVAASAATGTVRWRYTPPSPASMFGVPPFYNGVFYVRTDGVLRAVRARDGQQLWAAPVEGRAFEQQPPVFDQGVVYATAGASVVALRAADGGPLWQTSHSTTPGSPISALHVANGRVYVAFGAAAASVYALDARGGAVLWTHTEAAADGVSLTVAAGNVYAAFGARGSGVQPTTVVALGAGDGTVRWAYAVDGDADPLAVTNEVLVLSSRLLGLLALDAASGSLLWQRGDLGLHGDQSASPHPIISDGVLYLSGVVFDGQRGVVLALDVRTGIERWRTVLDQYADVFVSLAGPILYIGGGRTYGLHASDGHVVWRYGPGSGVQFYQPAAAAGVVFIGASDVGSSFHPFGIGSNDFLNALDARTGALFWRTSGIGDSTPLVYSS